MISRYFLITHFLQAVLLLVLSDYVNPWKTGEFKFTVILVLAIQIIVASILIRTKLIKSIWDFISLKLVKYYRFLEKREHFIAILFFIISIYFFNTSLNSYRYVGDSITDNGSILLYVSIILKPFGYLFFLKKYLNSRSGKKTLKKSRATGFFYLTGQMFFLTGVTSGVMFLVSSLIYFNVKRRRVLLLLPIILPALAILFIQVNAIKWKVDFTHSLLLLGEINWMEYMKYIITRLSISHYGFQYYLNEGSGIQIMEIVKAGFSRVFSVDLTDLESINRYNYENISKSVDTRSGTSPGILASFQIAFGNIIGLVLAPLYLAVVFYPFRRGGWLMLMLLLIFAQTVYKTPFQSFLLLDPNLIYVFLFLLTTSDYYLWKKKFQ